MRSKDEGLDEKRAIGRGAAAAAARYLSPSRDGQNAVRWRREGQVWDALAATSRSEIFHAPNNARDVKNLNGLEHSYVTCHGRRSTTGAPHPVRQRHGMSASLYGIFAVEPARKPMGLWRRRRRRPRRVGPQGVASLLAAAMPQNGQPAEDGLIGHSWRNSWRRCDTAACAASETMASSMSSLRTPQKLKLGLIQPGGI